MTETVLLMDNLELFCIYRGQSEDNSIIIYYNFMFKATLITTLAIGMAASQEVFLSQEARLL
jgi:hypothetical protein